MQFYKKRDFGELITDTFNFVREYGKNYFKNFFILNGGITLLLLIVIVLGYGELFQQMFSSNLEGQQFYYEQYFSENQGVFIGVTLLAFLLGYLLMMITYSFPVLYMRRLSKNPSEHISSEQMMNDIKGIGGKFFIFSLGLLFIIIPLSVILFLISTALMLLLIGFFLILIIFPIILNIINLALFEYYHTQSGFFNALGFAIRTQFSNNFFKYLGSIIIIYLVITTITSIFSLIPMLAIVTGGYILPVDTVLEGNMVAQAFYAAIYILYFFANLILSNIIYINAGFIYYDAKKEFHQEVQMSEIESLGNSL